MTDVEYLATKRRYPPLTERASTVTNIGTFGTAEEDVHPTTANNLELNTKKSTSSLAHTRH